MKTLQLASTLVFAAAAVCLNAAEPSKYGNQDLRKLANQIDQQVASFYRNKKLPVPQVTDDATFMRRAFLVAIGRIPTPEEALAFIEIDDPSKRENLIDYLLASPGFSSHMSNWAYDLLRVTDRRTDSQSTNAPYRHWVRKSMADNTPWDVLTRHLISSTGDGWDPETASVGYYTRDRGMPLDNLSNTMRIFLGTRMECAQCHDDPFGTTERHDFYELAAFTHGQEPVRRNVMQPLWDELSNDERRNSEEYRIAQTIWDNVYNLSLGGGGEGRIALPSDYQYRDGSPGQVVGGRTPFGKTVRMSEKRKSDDGRANLAEWIVGRTDAQFPGVIANRMWKRVMGKGLYEPVDEYIPAAKTHHPALASLLGRTMVELKYDLRAFQHVLLLTKTFQFATNPKPSIVDAGDDFHGRKIERLSAEQIWDSLITLAAGDPDKKPMRGLDERIFVGNRPVLVGRKTMRQLSKEVLAITTEAEMRQYFAKFVAEVRDGGQSGGGGDSMSMMSGGPSYGRDSLVRASELPSPAPRDHFLYLFGSSDREVVESASRDPNVGQVLSLMNGFVQARLVNDPKAHLYKSLEGATTDSEKVRRLYITILNRPPTQEEMGWMLDELKNRDEEGVRNIVSALVMSSEFLFLQ